MDAHDTLRQEERLLGIAPLKGRRVAALVADGFEQAELREPMEALILAGATVDIVSPNINKVRGWKDSEWGEYVEVDVPIMQANSKLYDALLLPGGVKNPDTLRTDWAAVDFVRHFIASGKPVGAICHAPWMLIEAEADEGVALTSYPSLRTDLVNAGALWIDTAVVSDKGIVTSRRPADIPLFSAKLIDEIRESAHRTGPACAVQPP